nr:hypothetical protein HK105_002611 [Polyrhizophydium stewartii]
MLDSLAKADCLTARRANDLQPLKKAFSQPLSAVHTFNHKEYREYEKRLFAVVELILKGLGFNSEDSELVYNCRCFLITCLRTKSPRLAVNITIADVIVASALYSISVKWALCDDWLARTNSEDEMKELIRNRRSDLFIFGLRCYIAPNIDALLNSAHGRPGREAVIKYVKRIRLDMHVDMANAETIQYFMHEVTRLMSLLDAFRALRREIKDMAVNDLPSRDKDKFHDILLSTRHFVAEILDVLGVPEGSKRHCRAMRTLEANIRHMHQNPLVKANHAVFSTLADVLGLTDCQEQCFGSEEFTGLDKAVINREGSKSKIEDPHWLSHAARELCGIPLGTAANPLATIPGVEREATHNAVCCGGVFLRLWLFRTHMLTSRKQVESASNESHAMMCTRRACQYAGVRPR